MKMSFVRDLVEHFKRKTIVTEYELCNKVKPVIILITFPYQQFKIHIVFSWFSLIRDRFLTHPVQTQTRKIVR